ncbi:hypothetical protein Gotri_003461, partial [Gossypium trilobum]|nr:hypothetical protein [Gossypium trilobum]
MNIYIFNKISWSVKEIVKILHKLARE